MVSMPRHQIEEQHHAMPGVTMREYLAHHARRNRRDPPPSDEIEGPVHAELYRGLWIVRCPADPCAGACVASSLDPVYFCPDCGAGWFDVIFPVNKTAIERELMKRPPARQGLIHANWKCGESLAKLRRETKAQANV